MPRPLRQKTFSSALVPFVLSLVRMNGKDATRLEKKYLRAKAADGSALPEISLADLNALLEDAAKELEDPLFGLHAALAMPRGSYGLLEFALRAAPTGKRAMEQLAEYGALINPLVRWTLEVDGDEVALHHRAPQRQGSRAAALAAASAAAARDPPRACARNCVGHPPHARRRPANGERRGSCDDVAALLRRSGPGPRLGLRGVLVGLPELEDRLSRRHHRSLYSRIHTRLSIDPLTPQARRASRDGARGVLTVETPITDVGCAVRARRWPSANRDDAAIKHRASQHRGAPSCLVALTPSHRSATNPH